MASGISRADPQSCAVVHLAWGTSFGGGHAIHTGATVQGVSAVIAQCPFTDGTASGLAMNPITALRVSSLAIADQLRAWLGAQPLMVATSGSPRSAALMTAHDCLSGYLNLVPHGGVPFENRVAARVALQIMAYRPGRLAPPKFDLAERVVAITGSTGGLGSAVAAALRAKGARLALFDLDLAKVEAQAETLGGLSLARGWTANVRNMESLEAAMAEAAAHFGHIDVVIANAGIDTIAPMATLDPEAFERVIDINLNGVWRTFRAGLPYVQKRQGYLMGISSMAAFVHSQLQASYTSSKAGVWALCDSIRLELQHLGVGVGSVHPTFFPAPMWTT